MGAPPLSFLFSSPQGFAAPPRHLTVCEEALLGTVGNATGIWSSETGDTSECFRMCGSDSKVSQAKYISDGALGKPHLWGELDKGKSPNTAGEIVYADRLWLSFQKIKT